MCVIFRARPIPTTRSLRRICRWTMNVKRSVGKPNAWPWPNSTKQEWVVPFLCVFFFFFFLNLSHGIEKKTSHFLSFFFLYAPHSLLMWLLFFCFLYPSMSYIRMTVGDFCFLFFFFLVWFSSSLPYTLALCSIVACYCLFFLFFSRRKHYPPFSPFFLLFLLVLLGCDGHHV